MDIGNPKRMMGLELGRMIWFEEYENPSPNAQHLAGLDLGTACQTDPSIRCSSFTGVKKGVTLVNIVRLMTEYGIRVDPLVMRAKTFPQYGDMIVMSDNPSLIARLPYPVGTTLPLIPSLFPGMWDDDPFRSSTPNNFTHELVHPPGYRDTEPSMPYHVNISNPSGPVPRGYALGGPGVSQSADCNHIARWARGGL
jgi:hypothetical protein